MHPQYTPQDVERFWSKVDKRGPDECWLWTASKNKGYGRFRVRGVGYAVQAQRVSYEMTYGPIPQGLWVLHKCDVPACVNPNHLFLGTNTDNIKDFYSKGYRKSPWMHPEQRPKGDAHANSKLTDKQVGEILHILKDENVNRDQLAKRYGISPSLISAIANRKRRVHISIPD